MAEPERVLSFTERLRALKTHFRPFERRHHLNGLHVHPRLREEVARIYNDHGGLAILMDITRLSKDTILKWYSKFKADPTCFQGVPLRKRVYPKSATASRTDDFKEYLTQTGFYRDVRTVGEIRARMPKDLLASVDQLSEKVHREESLTAELKLEIVKLALKAGDAKPVALLLGFERRSVLGWKSIFAQAVAELKLSNPSL